MKKILIFFILSFLTLSLISANVVDTSLSDETSADNFTEPNLTVQLDLGEAGWEETTIIKNEEELNTTFFKEKSEKKCMLRCVDEILNKSFVFSNENEVTGEAYMVVEMLKQMNFGLGEELDECQTKLDKSNWNRNIIIVSVLIAFILVIWKTVDVINNRRKK